MRTLIKGLVLALSTSFLVACGGGSPIGKALDHKIAMLKIVETNKTDAAKAATELEAYVKTNEADIKALTAEMEKVQKEVGEDPAKIADMLKDNMSKFQEVTELEAKVAKEATEVYSDPKVSELLRSVQSM